MKRIVYSLSFLGLALLLLLSSCKSEAIYIDAKDSHYVDYQIENDKVTIKCFVTIMNEYDVEKSVTLSASLPKDVELGLLKDERVRAQNEDGTDMVFILQPHSASSFDVCFVGDYAGTNQKSDRNLPEIDITIKESNK